MAFGFDPSIILATPRQDPFELPRTLAQLSGAAQQRQMGQATLADMYRKQAREQTLADLARQNAGAFSDPLASAYAGGGFGAQAIDAQESAARRQKTEADERKQRTEILARSFRGGIKSQNDLNAALEAARIAGVSDIELLRFPREFNEQNAPIFDHLALMADRSPRQFTQEELDAMTARAGYDRAKTDALKNKPPGDGGPGFKDIQSLRKEVNADKAIAKYRQASAELSSLKALAKDSTGASDMAIVFAFMKSLDPDSAVREAEYAAAAATGTPDQRMMGLVSKYWTGGPLSDGQRAAFIQAAEAAQSGHKASSERAAATYRTAAKKYGIDLAEIGIDDDAPAAGAQVRVRQKSTGKIKLMNPSVAEKLPPSDFEVLK